MAPRSVSGDPVFLVPGALSSGGRTPAGCAGPPGGGPDTGASGAFSTSVSGVVLRSSRGESRVHPQSRDRNENIVEISYFAPPADFLRAHFMENETAKCRFLAERRKAATF